LATAAAAEEGTACLRALRPALEACSGFGPQSLANVIWALGALASADDELRSRLEAAAAPRVATFGAVEVAALCWSHAVLARPVDGAWLGCLAARYPDDDGDAYGLSNLLWGFAVARSSPWPPSQALRALRRAAPRATPQSIWRAVDALAVPQCYC